MRQWLERVARRLRMPKNNVVRVTGAQSVAPGLAVFAIDVDGRRIILGASTHALCVIDRYLAPKSEDPAGPSDPRG